MLQPTLFFGTLFSLTSATIYFYVGENLKQRYVVSADARLAWRLFVLCWYALGGTTCIGGLLNLLGGFGITHLPLFLTFTQVNLLAISIALYGLMYYLLYLFTGNQKLFVPLTIFYIAYYILLLYYVNVSEPTGVSVNRWSTVLVYQQQATGPLYFVVLALLLFPQIIGSAAYFSLYFRVEDATQKYRIAMVSGGIFIWFLSSVLSSAVRLSQYDWWQVISRLIGLGAALSVLMAYRPTKGIKQWLGVTSMDEENIKNLSSKESV